MGLLDRWLGRLTGRGGGTSWPGSGPVRYGPPGAQSAVPGRGPAPNPDAQAVAQYQYLLRTAPPDQIERAHAQAFESLTHAQREQVLQQLAAADPAERPTNDSPAALARTATRQEMRSPGSLQRTLGGAGMGRMGGAMGMGMGGMLLASVAGAFMGSAIANEMFDNDGFMDWDRDSQPDEQAFADSGSEGDYQDAGGDFSAGDVGGSGDFGGGDFGGFGGDF
ncbi:MAG TPA: hypothetical protein VES01_05705 [Dermatophilaceae bacterium]|nr:hypothetical protein [Dermatophilaceae bacterium]